MLRLISGGIELKGFKLRKEKWFQGLDELHRPVKWLLNQLRKGLKGTQHPVSVLHFGIINKWLGNTGEGNGRWNIRIARGAASLKRHPNHDSWQLSCCYSLSHWYWSLYESVLSKQNSQSRGRMEERTDNILFLCLGSTQECCGCVWSWPPGKSDWHSGKARWSIREKAKTTSNKINEVFTILTSMFSALMWSLGCLGSPSMGPLSSKMVVFNPYVVKFFSQETEGNILAKDND